MTILAGDIKLVKTQVMQDVPEGGGAPTGIVIVDGRSNEIFTDISEADRAGGRVNLRKLALHIDSVNVDDYLGANIIISKPPNDPNVSITLMAGTTFDERLEAAARISAYLSIGVQYPAYLFGNHIQGQSTIAVFQKTADLPEIGAVLVLTKREGYGDEHEQYIKVIEVVSSVLTVFEDDRGTYSRYVITLGLATPLDADFPGFDIQRYEYTKAQIALLTKISDTVTANAANYYGVVELAEDAGVGDFTFTAASIFSQLVPSAQIETPLTDVRTNQVSNGVLPSGGTVVHNVTALFTIAQNIYIGGPFAPNSLNLSASGIVVTDQGGKLMSAGSQVGICDYENGVLTLTVNVFGTAALPFAIVYAPASVPPSVNQSQGFKITATNRATNYVRTIEPAPARGTLSIEYMSQGRWYVLREDGSGAIRGSDAAYGAGSLNFTTGTMVASLGALPDVGSSIIYQWVETTAARDSSLLTLDNDGNLYWPFNTSGQSSINAGAKSIQPGHLSITWTDPVGPTVRTVTDNGAGALQGYATGSVDYAKGVIRMSPTTLPPPGTVVNVAVDAAVLTSGTATVASGSGSLGVTGVTPGSVELVVTAQLRYVYGANPIANWGAPGTYRITDDGAGSLYLHLNDTTLACGAINYSAGTFTLSGNVIIPFVTAVQLTAWDNIYKADNTGLNMFFEVI
ncbi:hypothetical protein BH11PSE13_BH11PSE13_12140 [soil metagenome]